MHLRPGDVVFVHELEAMLTPGERADLAYLFRHWDARGISRVELPEPENDYLTPEEQWSLRSFLQRQGARRPAIEADTRWGPE
jgi:hypothetical protein